ncbi:shikimate dehydrogenase [Tistlia consotensis]|uniref:Shikimate dehydrogenase (NADP(+)) n=1 Tax=Tistlia consotensis USBA 355 TaxID=560819 RepID=A0A1Y6BB35_9PROT|nr:shikimate dehydrogenase [Tistlia consotensis]SMF02277.1 shikimate dehydrogenase [Tistlia consotensis USBA 355]SNS26621.1 shikimate dehydrogenase [Tistlia consotensis]
MAAPADNRSYLVGLIGSGIGGSRSPALHESEAASQGLRYLYKLVDLQRLGGDAAILPRLLEAMELTGFTGTNVTHPCKHAVVPLLDQLSPAAAAIGAVNTVVFAEGRRSGHNTDCWGFAESFRRGLPDAEREVVVQLGAGGAGAAVAVAALDLGVRRLLIHDREAARADALVERLSARPGDATVERVDDLRSALAAADGLIHATPTGMAGHGGIALDPDLLHAGQWVADVVYVPLETELLKAARQRGCRTLDGGGMAVFQAVRAFELFTGIRPDAERMLHRFAEL